MSIVLKGGRVVDPATGTDAPADVLIKHGIVRDVGANLDGTKVIDCDGAVIAPGFVDLHTHLREPGRADDETIESGSRAAAAGGFTCVHAMPNTEPAADNASVVEMVVSRGREFGLCDVRAIGAITKGRAGHELAPMGEMHRSRAAVTMFSDDGDPVPTARLMRRALEYARAFDAVIIDHAEDPSMREGGHMHEGGMSALLGVPGIAAEAEEICVLRDVTLARLTGARLHIAHLSTSGAAEAVKQARAAGVNVTCEVTPHHLALTDESLQSFDPAFKVAPPLRDSAHVQALKAAVADGTVDAIATDHAPHAPHRKDREFDHAPCGMVGLETAFAVCFSELVEAGICTLAKLVELMSSNPARIAGVEERHGSLQPGRPANLVVLDTGSVWTVEGERLHGRSRNTPFAGRKVTGRVVHTLLDGEFTCRDGEPVR